MEINISSTLARHALGVATPARYTKLCGVELAYSDSEGSGLPIVCLHAIGHGARDFVPLRARLDPGYRFITLDWPGQGRSGEDVPPDLVHLGEERSDRFLCAKPRGHREPPNRPSRIFRGRTFGVSRRSGRLCERLRPISGIASELNPNSVTSW